MSHVALAGNARVLGGTETIFLSAFCVKGCSFKMVVWNEYHHDLLHLLSPPSVPQTRSYWSDQASETTTCKDMNSPMTARVTLKTGIVITNQIMLVQQINLTHWKRFPRAKTMKNFEQREQVFFGQTSCHFLWPSKGWNSTVTSCMNQSLDGHVAIDNKHYHYTYYTIKYDAFRFPKWVTKIRVTSLIFVRLVKKNLSKNRKKMKKVLNCH